MKEIVDNRLIVDIGNNPDIYDTIVDSIPYLKYWSVECNVNKQNSFWDKYRNKLPRFLAFDFKNKRLFWPFDDNDSDILSYTIKDIPNVKAATDLMNEIYTIEEKHNSKLGPRI